MINIFATLKGCPAFKSLRNYLLLWVAAELIKRKLIIASKWGNLSFGAVFI
ncbi:hypothetical protein [Peribacillus frigoritolerans]